eukprot:8515488-Lingulodinium_polyedra.AAC.1
MGAFERAEDEFDQLLARLQVPGRVLGARADVALEDPPGIIRMVARRPRPRSARAGRAGRG